MAAPEELEVKVKVTADPASIALADRVAEAIKRLREVISSSPVTSSVFTAERDALRDALNQELLFIKQAIAEKVATEEEGQQARLEILQRYEAKFKALNASFAAPNQNVPLPTGFFKTPTGTTTAATIPAPTTAPPVQGIRDVGRAIIDASLANKEFTLSLEHGRALLEAVDNDYNRFTKDLARIKDAYEQATLAAGKYNDTVSRTPNATQTGVPGVTAGAASTSTTGPTAAPAPQLGPALPPGFFANQKAATEAVTESTNAVKTFNLTTEQSRKLLAESGNNLEVFKKKVLALAEAHDRDAAAARGEAVATQASGDKLQLFGRAADATFERVPRGARTAANGLSILALSVQSSSSGAISAVRAFGNMAFGLSQLSTSANIVAGAAGIGAVVTIVATLVELLARGTEKTREQEAALKSFSQTNEAFAERAKVTADLLDRLRNVKGANLSGVDFVGLTKQVDDLHKALVEAEKDSRKAFTVPSFSQGLEAAAGGDAQVAVIALSDKLRKLRKDLLDDKITADQFATGLQNLGKSFPDLLPQIVKTAQLAANYESAREALRKFTAEAKQTQAQKIFDKAVFGETPELTKNLEEVSARLLAVQKGGPIAAQAIENEQKAMVGATEAWKLYVSTKKGSQFADIAYRDALEANDRARNGVQKQLNEELKTRNATQIEVTKRLNDAQREARVKFFQSMTTITQGQEVQNLPSATDALRKSNADLAKARAERFDDEVETKKEEARIDSELTIKRLRENTALEVNGGRIRNNLIANERERLRLQLLKIDEDAAKSLIEASTRSAVDVAKKQAAAETAVLNISKDTDDRALKAKLNSREITQTEFNERTLAREIQFADDLLEIQLRSLDAQTKAIQSQIQLTPRLKPAEKKKLEGDLESLSLEREKAEADAADRRAKAAGNALEQTGTLSKRITDETAQAQVQILRLTGRNAEASAEEIKQRFKDLLAELRAIGGPGSQEAVDIVIRLRGLAGARAELEGLEQDVGEKLGIMQAKLNQIHVMLGAHAITEREARKQIVAAEIAARDAILQSLPALEKQARLLGDHKSAQQVLELKTQLIELEEQIRRNSDEFFRLKEVIRESAQTALENVLIEAPQIAFGGGGQQDEINVLKDHVQLAKDELQKLLDLPTSDRTDVVNNRITELRREIDETTNSLNNAKNAIDGWKNLFIRAIDSILDAMLKLEAQMIAQIALEKISQIGKIIFGLAGAAAGGGGGTKFVDDIGGGGTMFAAEGGPVFGPGTTTSDSIPARLSNKEFVEPATATEHYGFGIFELLRRKLIPRELIMYITKGLTPLQPRTVTAHRPFAADGGLVSIPQQAHGTQAQPNGQTRLIIEAGEDTAFRVMESDRGMQIQFRHMENNINGLRALLGI